MALLKHTEKNTKSKPKPKPATVNSKNCSCLCISLCTIVLHNTAQNSPDNLRSYPPDIHRRGHVLSTGQEKESTATL